MVVASQPGRGGAGQQVVEQWAAGEVTAVLTLPTLKPVPEFVEGAVTQPKAV